jgi:Zn-dependent protease
MNTRIELGRIAGIPIFLDMFFILVAVLLTSRYFTSGDTQVMSAGVVIVIGLLVSILLHELGHAFAGRMFGQEVSHIELMGLGGLCQFKHSLPKSAVVRTIIYLAGPAMNLLLWLAFKQLALTDVVKGKLMLFLALQTLSINNLYLMLFNLLPAYPLDGGHTLDAWLGAIFGPNWARRLVAMLGLVITAGLVYLAFPSDFWLLFLAFILFQINWSALQSVGGPTGRG